MPQDFVFNNPSPQAGWQQTANQILDLAQTMQEGDVKASLVKAAGGLTSIAMRPELNNARFVQELEKLNMTIQAKAVSQGATLADKTAARAMNLQLAAMKGDQRQTEIEMKNLQQIALTETKQAGDLKKVRESKGLDIEREKLKQSGAQDVFMLKSMDRADQEVRGNNRKIEWYYRERASQKMDELDTLARNQAEERAMIETARKSAIYGPNDPTIKLVQERVKTASPAAQEEFGRVMRLAEKAVDAKIARAMATPEIRDAMRTYNIEVDMDELRQETARTQSPLRYLEKKIEVAKENAVTNAQGEKMYWETKAALDARKVPTQIQDAVLNKLGWQPKQTPEMAKTTALAEAEGLVNKGRLWKGAKGVGAAVALAYIGSKFLGGGDEKAVDPQLQMMLMQQMAQRGGGEDEGQTQGRELQNLSRAMNILKTMQQMQGSQMDAPVSVSRLL